MEKKNINEIYLAWRKVKRQLVKESSMATYEVNAEKHILPAFGRLTDICEADVQAFALGMVKDGLSMRTVRDVLLVLKMIAVYGWRQGWLERREWDIRLPRHVPGSEPAVLTPCEQRRVMAFVSGHFSFRNLGIYICLCTGMRIGEICALKWDDIDVDMRVVKVSRTIERIYVNDGHRRRTKLVIGPPKTASSRREIPVSGDLLGMLKASARLACPGGYVLTNTVKPLEPRLYRRYYQRLMAGLGLPGIKFHGLRHTFATRCIESQCDYKTVSTILGHSNVNTTLNLYVHPDIEAKRKCIDRMMRSVMK